MIRMTSINRSSSSLSPRPKLRIAAMMNILLLVSLSSELSVFIFGGKPQRTMPERIPNINPQISWKSGGNSTHVEDSHIVTSEDKRRIYAEKKRQESVMRAQRRIDLEFGTDEDSEWYKYFLACIIDDGVSGHIIRLTSPIETSYQLDAMIKHLNEDLDPDECTFIDLSNEDGENSDTNTFLNDMLNAYHKIARPDRPAPWLSEIFEDDETSERDVVFVKRVESETASAKKLEQSAKIIHFAWML